MSVPTPAAQLPGGVAMPLLGLGTWQLSGEAGYRAVRTALETGYRSIDTATTYGNEAEVGRALRDSGLAREEVFVTTKLPPQRAGREEETLRASLDALGTSFVDLWLVHWPPDGRARPSTWERFLAAREQGLARAVGVSNYSTAQVDELVAATGEAPAVDQVRWGPALHDPRFLHECAERGVVVEGYSPFKSTDLGDPVLAEVAAAHGVTPQQVVLRWHLEHGIVVIPKSASPERIAANADVLGFSLSAQEVTRVDGLSRVRR
ncbi:aldo/keto reductase [Quadrisphaera sp. DSM 44207]|uniref:aldo/keto reductase n=1 Tax=Quadrisphaera sp. DSM 44207 TaxID=1881057 RepID=UPI00088C3E9A|nr:aldo/keto reductase [Quadrisphaera sp. DSM 44207]SDQ43751.1 Aldo/keto reductase [Quadrisphaera sp. DSM 44207]